MKLTSLILTACLLAVPMGCHKATPTNPAVLAPGYISQADQTLGTTLKGIHDFYNGLTSRIAADKRILGPTENAALTSLSLAINTADTVYVAYHNGQATLQQAQAAVSNASTAQANAQAQVKP